MSRYEDDRGEHLSRRDPEQLNDGEWRVLMAYRMDQVERRVDKMLRALWANLGAVAVGIIVYLLTTNLGGAG